MEIPNSAELKRLNILNEGAATFNQVASIQDEKIDFIEALYLCLSYAAWADGVLQDTEKKVFTRIFESYKNQIPETEHFLFKNALSKQPQWDSFADKLKTLNPKEKLIILKHSYDLFNCDQQYTQNEQEAMNKLISALTQDETTQTKIVTWLDMNKKLRLLTTEIIQNL